MNRLVLAEYQRHISLLLIIRVKLLHRQMRCAESSFQTLVRHILAFYVKNVNLNKSADFAIIEITKWHVSGGARKRNIPPLWNSSYVTESYSGT